MRRLMLGLPVLAFGLACAGMLPEPLDDATPDASDLSGRWCEEDPEVGCYRFEGATVYEEEVQLSHGKKLAAEGTWSVDGSLLLMRFPNGTWTLDVQTYTGEILIAHDHSQGDTFTFVKQ